jgi:hypothetical protein
LSCFGTCKPLFKGGTIASALNVVWIKVVAPLVPFDDVKATV